jgi:hypothetical protein
MKKHSFIILICLILILGGCSSFFAPPKTHREVPTSEFGKLFQPSELKEDLNFLFKTMESVHPNLYAYTSRSIIDKERENILNSLISPMDRIDFYTKVAPIVTKLNDGHTNLSVPYEEYFDFIRKGGLLFPFSFSFQGDKAFILRNFSSDSSIAKGIEAISINEIPIKLIKDSLVQFKSGERYQFKIRIVQNILQFMLWVVYKMKDNFTVEYVSPTSGVIERKVVRGAADSAIYKIYQKETAGIVNYYYKYFSFPEDRIGLIDFRAFYNSEQFKTFLSKTFLKIKNDSIKNLIIDIRNNGGGDSRLGDELLQYLTDKPVSQFSKMELKVSSEIKKFYKDFLPGFIRWMPIQYLHPFGWKVWCTKEGEIAVFSLDPETPDKNPLTFKGNIYLLIGSGTFSSAVAFATAIKDYNLGKIIGEETGGLASAYGDIYSFDLPNTNLQAGVSHKHFYRPSGIDDGNGVLPNFEVIQTFEDSKKNIDTIMEFTKNLIKKNN